MLAAGSQDIGGGDETGPYELVAGWPENPCGEGHSWGSTGGIWAISPDRVFIFQRGCLPVLEDTRATSENFIPIRNAAEYSLSETDPTHWPKWVHILTVFDRSGTLVESWEQHNARFVRPHRVRTNPHDPEGHIWIIDDGAQQVMKFTKDGKRLVMVLGEFRVSGNDRSHFYRPTDVAWLPSGEFFVTDGYRNTRVLKFSADGKYLMEWGTRGTGPGQFNTVHGIEIDENRRLYVIDRENSRIQIFDENGRFLSMWPNIRRPYAIYLTQDRHLWVTDGITQKFLKFDLEGHLLYSWGTFGKMPGGFWGVHQVSVDSEGNLYTADVHIGRPQKFRPKAGADPAKLIGRGLNTRY
jgi:peptidylamidoglycolate lyase